MPLSSIFGTSEAVKRAKEELQRQQAETERLQKENKSVEEELEAIKLKEQEHEKCTQELQQKMEKQEKETGDLLKNMEDEAEKRRQELIRQKQMADEKLNSVVSQLESTKAQFEEEKERKQLEIEKQIQQAVDKEKKEMTHQRQLAEAKEMAEKDKLEAEMASKAGKHEYEKKSLESEKERLQSEKEQLKQNVNQNEEKTKQMEAELHKEQDSSKNKVVNCERKLMVQYGEVKANRKKMIDLMTVMVPKMKQINKYKWMPPPTWIALYAAFFLFLTLRMGDLSVLLNGLTLGFVNYVAYIVYMYFQGCLLMKEVDEASLLSYQIHAAEETVFASMEALTGFKTDVPPNRFQALKLEQIKEELEERTISNSILKQLIDVIDQFKEDTKLSNEKLLSIQSAAPNKQEGLAAITENTIRRG